MNGTDGRLPICFGLRVPDPVLPAVYPIEIGTGPVPAQVTEQKAAA
jgi:hypothetical protein